MMNVKHELQYLLVVQQLEILAEGGYLTPEELTAAKELTWEKYRPQTVWR